MQEKFGALWKKSFFTKKKLWLPVVICLCLLLCLDIAYVYLNYIQPSINTFKPRDYHHGTQFYTEGTYKDFDHGDHFTKILSELDYISGGEIIDFWHYENKHFDNPLRGKRFDIFSLDIQFDSTKHTEHKNKIDETALYLRYEGDFDLYLSDYGEEYAVVTAVCYDQNIIRIIFMPDFDKVDEIIANGKIISTSYFHNLNYYLTFDYPPSCDYRPEYREPGT